MSIWNNILRKQRMAVVAAPAQHPLYADLCSAFIKILFVQKIVSRIMSIFYTATFDVTKVTFNLKQIQIFNIVLVCSKSICAVLKNFIQKDIAFMQIKRYHSLDVQRRNGRGR